MESGNVRTIRRLYDLFNKLDTDPASRAGSEAEQRALELFDPEVEFIQPDIQVDRVETRGRDELRQVWDEWLTVWESHRSRIEDVVEREDRVLVISRNHFRSPDGDELEQIGHDLYTFRDGLIVRFEPFLADADSARAALERS